ncbi:TPA: hypothetical protein HA246_01100 [Candidatus Woesearchaeota archaeon]|nr:hypothetical protein [Candidatus Woesearchaeota archaeon]
MIKLFFDSEDALWGMIVGALVLGLAGSLPGNIKIPFNKEILIGALVLYVPIILMDIGHEVHDLSRHPFFILLSILHSLVDLAIVVGFFGLFFNFNLSYVSQFIVPLLKNASTLIYVGYFFLVGNFIWLIIYPFVM